MTLWLCVAGILAVTRFRRGSLVSPMSVTLLILLSIFGVRPIMMVDANRYNFYGGNTIADGYEIAAWVGLLSVVFVLFGYFIGTFTARERPAPLTVPSDVPKSSGSISLVKASLVSTLILAVWLALMVVTGGGFAYIALLFQGRGAGSESLLAGVPAIVPALPVVAALFLAYVRINVRRGRSITARENVLYWLVIALTIIPPSALGSRRLLLPSVIAAVLGALPPTWFRAVTWRMVALAVVGFLALSIFPFVRSSGSRTSSTDLLGAMGDYFGAEGLSGTLENFFLSYDTEMFNYIAFLATRLGGSIEYGLGRGTIGEALLSPIPASLAPGPTWSNEILIQAFGGSCGVSYCPVPSVSGILFYDLGLPGVVAGMFIVGLVMSRFEAKFLKANGWRLMTLLTLAAFVPQVIRGNSISQLWIAVQVVLVLIVVSKATDLLEGQSGGAPRRSPRRPSSARAHRIPAINPSRSAPPPVA